MPPASSQRPSRASIASAQVTMRRRRRSYRRNETGMGEQQEPDMAMVLDHLAAARHRPQRHDRLLDFRHDLYIAGRGRGEERQRFVAQRLDRPERRRSAATATAFICGKSRRMTPIVNAFLIRLKLSATLTATGGGAYPALPSLASYWSMSDCSATNIRSASSLSEMQADGRSYSSSSEARWACRTSSRRSPSQALLRRRSVLLATVSFHLL